MSVSGAFLIVITASFLKPLLSATQSLQQPSVTRNDRRNDVSPFEESDAESDDTSKLFLTFRLPQLLESAKNADLDSKRQFDPWGGKRQSKSAAKNEEISRKRQFSPWGGKRSSLYMDDNDFRDKNNERISSESKRNFNSWGGKRGFNSWGGKRGFNSWGGKRNYNITDEKKSFNSWGGKRRFNSWGGKRRFNAWGGKRFMKDMNKNFDAIFYEPKNENMDNKRQGFNSWGGKRSFNSWGGKRAFTYSVDKRASSSKTKTDEFGNIKDDNLMTPLNIIEEETENNVL